MKPKYTIEQIQPIIETIMDINKIEFIGNGNHSDAYCINNEIVFKFPRHKKASDCIEKEIIILEKIHGIFDIEIPNVIYKGKFVIGEENFQFFASKRLKGKPLLKQEFIKLPNDNLDNAAKVLAKFLITLHSVDIQKSKKNFVLLHGDFSLDHILFENGMVSGVLDFADSKIGKSKSDFKFLLDDKDEEEFGLEFGKKVFEYYNL